MAEVIERTAVMVGGVEIPPADIAAEAQNETGDQSGAIALRRTCTHVGPSTAG